MNGNIENEFDILYENNSTTNYLVLRAKDDGCILNYQVQMLLNNDISGLLRFNINYIGDGMNCFYNVTSKCTLMNFMSRKKFTRNEFLIMLLNIINSISNIKNYLLYDYNILLDERYIYVDPEKMELYFVYLPFKRNKCDYKTFLLKLIVEMANFYNEDSDNYLQRILEVIKDDLFNLSTLKIQLETLLKNDIKNQPQSLGISPEYKADPVHEKRTERKSDKRVNEKIYKKPENELPAKSVKIPMLKGESTSPGSSRPVITPEKSAKKLNKQTADKKLNIGFLLLQPILAVIYLIIITSGLVDTGEGKSVTAIITFVIFVCVDILIFRLIREKIKDAAKGGVADALSFITQKMRAEVFSTKEKAGQNIISGQETCKDQIPEPQSTFRGETEIIRKPRISAKAYLKETEGDKVIELNKNSILVGRMEGFVDAVINSSAVGKIHAEVISEEGYYFLVDCNSRNGTFINDKRLVPNTRNKIQNNDLIRFANKDFELITSVKSWEEAV